MSRHGGLQRGQLAVLALAVGGLAALDIGPLKGQALPVEAFQPARPAYRSLLAAALDSRPQSLPIDRRSDGLDLYCVHCKGKARGGV